MIAFGLKELFEAEGANVHIASSPDDALSLADDLVISAAVIDFGSSADDWRLCRTLRAYGIPFMYYTGYDDVEEGRWSAPVITKPASAQVLIATLAQLLCGAGHQLLKQYRNRSPRRALSNLRRSKPDSYGPYRRIALKVVVGIEFAVGAEVEDDRRFANQGSAAEAQADGVYRALERAEMGAAAGVTGQPLSTSTCGPLKPCRSLALYQEKYWEFDVELPGEWPISRMSQCISRELALFDRSRHRSSSSAVEG